MSKQIVQTVCESKLILNELLEAMSHDYSRFASAMNVATYSLLLAQKWGITNEQELLRIGQGALLHDIGMRHVPRHILDKPAKFTSRERQIVQRHATQGFMELCHRDDLTVGQLMMVYSHHERCDGGGYPCGLVRQEIHEYARIFAIADVYAAMLGDRAHCRAARKSNILSYLDHQAGRAVRRGNDPLLDSERRKRQFGLPTMITAEKQADDELDGLLDRLVALAEEPSPPGGKGDFKGENDRRRVCSPRRSDELDPSAEQSAKRPDQAAAPAEGFFPVAPRSLAETQVNELFMEGIVLRCLALEGSMKGVEISQIVGLPYGIVEKLLHGMKTRRLLMHRLPAASRISCTS